MEMMACLISHFRVPDLVMQHNSNGLLFLDSYHFVAANGLLTFFVKIKRQLALSL